MRNSVQVEKNIYAAFIDFRTAFDVVNRELLLSKFIGSGIHGKMYFSIKNIYKLTEASVQINGQHSDWFIIKNEVRQGDTLSTTLFLVYINDFVNELNRLDVGININGTKLCTLFYANDVVLFADNPDDLQKMLRVFNEWSDGNFMLIGTSRILCI